MHALVPSCKKADAAQAAVATDTSEFIGTAHIADNFFKFNVRSIVTEQLKQQAVIQLTRAYQSTFVNRNKHFILRALGGSGAGNGWAGPLGRAGQGRAGQGRAQSTVGVPCAKPAVDLLLLLTPAPWILIRTRPWVVLVLAGANEKRRCHGYFRPTVRVRAAAGGQLQVAAALHCSYPARAFVHPLWQVTTDLLIIIILARESAVIIYNYLAHASRSGPGPGPCTS